MAQNFLASNLFDTIDGLPIHPLAVHGAVVLLPLAAIALAILIFVPKWRKAYLPLTVGALAVSTVLAYIAKESGEALADRVGEPQTHADLGEILFPAAAGLTALALAFFFLQRKDRPKWQIQGVAAAALVGIISVSTLTYFVGHTGAQATWANRIAPPEAIDQTPTPTQSGEAAVALTLTEIAKHSTREDCWTAVEGTVYDLTPYMQKHPGGAASLAWLCGIDGTTAFRSQHGSESQPLSTLATLAIGPLVTEGAAPSTTEPTAEATATSKPSPTAAAGTYTAAEVAKHNSATDCWSVVSGNVYDLTSYVSNHPGGSSVIKAICGKDGSAAFAGQHSGASKPNNVLAGYKLGALATGNSSPLPQASAPAGEEHEEEGEDRD